jgi:hypothetical protein
MKNTNYGIPQYSIFSIFLLIPLCWVYIFPYARYVLIMFHCFSEHCSHHIWHEMCGGKREWPDMQVSQWEEEWAYGAWCYPVGRMFLRKAG